MLIQPGLLAITERGGTESRETEDKGLDLKDGHSWKSWKMSTCVYDVDEIFH